MSTPTPSGAPLQSQKHPHAVLTPNAYLASFSSPAPRSVPSPAGGNATRTTQTANHRASPFSGGRTIKQESATPQAHQSTQGSQLALNAITGFGSSPAMPLSFEGPAAMVLNFGGLDGGVGMGVSMSALGLGGAGARGRVDDEEKRRRWQSMMSILKSRPGRVSEEGLERLARRCGLETSRTGRVGDEKLLIAGDNLLVDVKFRGTAAEHVELVIPGLAESEQARGAAVLRRNLEPPPGVSEINNTLDRFADNLERLARLDRLSKAGASCFEAINGVYESLKSLFEQEKKFALDMIDPNRAHREKRAEREVLCRKSGRPVMHAGKRIGLSLQYWMEESQVFDEARKPASPDTRSGTEMDIDAPKHETEGDVQTFSLVIECESCPPELSIPIRLSTTWISERIHRPPEEMSPEEMVAASGSGQPIVEWQEPGPTYLAYEGQDGKAAASSAGTAMPKQPSVRFVARLEPEVVLPWQIADAIAGSVGAPPGHGLGIQSGTWKGMVLPDGERDAPMNLAGEGGGGEVRRERSVWVPGAGGDVEERRHAMSLFTQRAEYARQLEEIPFAHPRQLMLILPILRQYAFLTSLIRKPFRPNAPPLESTVSQPSSEGGALANADSVDREDGDAGAALAAFLDRSDTTDDASTLPIDVSLTTVPSPQLDVIFPLAARNSGGGDHRLAHVTLSIQGNAHVEVVDQDLVLGSDELDGDGADESSRDLWGRPGAGLERERQRMARALCVAEDLGLWAEWIRRTYS